ncbi:hypothetical protein [Pseudoprimorskyibacter insulae]|uniref:Uncharacterized protein n=1 Tax=Pseudoprimorskyibacter insulae TaxID=1695997 RepID=A0A2R8AU68_9RHOB|nr:hypothetical protein [Pseudoprimorskyibacter insulae]SPF79593.1 hypothetical protein PRI8871_01390 [Pseudoprimorskyibacter insulae]
MAPNFYLHTPLEPDFLFFQMKERLEAPGLLQEIRALDALAQNADDPALEDRKFLVPLLIRKITKTLAERHDALNGLLPGPESFGIHKTSMAPDASELIWRTVWPDASGDGPIDRRLVAVQTAGKALMTIEAWLDRIRTLYSAPPPALA